MKRCDYCDKETDRPEHAASGIIMCAECEKSGGSLSRASACSASDATRQEVIYWAQAILTALNAGGIDKDSPIHNKLREVIIKHRDAVERETANTEGQPRREAT